MSIERTNEEWTEQAELDAKVEYVLELARLRAASFYLADILDEPHEVCERWVDAMYDGLRVRLSPEERLRAIVLLLSDGARGDARRVLAEMSQR